MTLDPTEGEERDALPEAEAENQVRFDVCVVEDEQVVMDFLVQVLSDYYGDRVGEIIKAATVDEVRSLLEEEGHRLWITDVTLHRRTIPFQEILGYLERQELNTGWIITSAYDPKEYISKLGPSHESVKIEAAHKPFRVKNFMASLNALLDHLEGREPSAVSKKIEEPEESEEDEFVTPFASCSSLKELVRVLPAEPSKVLSPDVGVELPKLILREMRLLDRYLERDLDSVFVDCWQATFPSGEASRRKCLEGLLGELHGSGFVLSICIHDVKNIVHKVLIAGSTSVLKREAQIRIKDVLASFGEYCETGDSNCFWENQSLMEAISDNSDNFPNQKIELDDEDVLINCPIGGVRSILRTFYSNFAKVKRISGKDDAEQELFIYQDGNEVVFRISDNLKSF